MSDPAFSIPAAYRDRVDAAAQAADQLVGHDPASAEPLARQELELLREAEVAADHRLHKGHALHNLGAATLGRDHDEARRFFHGAYVEDVRSYPDPSGSVARATLQELYGETDRLMDELGERARASHADPLDVAQTFEADNELPEYRGLRKLWRELGSIEGIPAKHLVFVAGAHVVSDRMEALRKAVIKVGLFPVVVLEFVDFDKNAYTKSKTLISRCGAVLFDVSYSAAGYAYELRFAQDTGLPRWAGYVSWSAGDAPHAWAMTNGLFDEMGLRPAGTTSNTSLAKEAEVWLRQRLVDGELELLPSPAPAAQSGLDVSSPADFRMPAPNLVFPPEPPTKSRFARDALAAGSNTPFDFQEAQATTSGWQAYGPPDDLVPHHQPHVETEGNPKIRDLDDETRMRLGLPPKAVDKPE
jgi:hypothetical protein